MEAKPVNKPEAKKSKPEVKESKPEAKEEKAASQPVAAQPAATNTVFTLKSEQKFAANEPKVLGK